MTLNDISRKLIKNNYKQYRLFFFSVLFSITITGAYGVLQYSRTITDVLVDGGSTQTISQGMYFGTMFGIIVFLIYADSLFLQYKSREIGVFLSLGINRKSVQKIIMKEFNILFQCATIIGLILSIPVAYICWSTLNLFLKTKETTFQIGWSGIIIAICFSAFAWLIIRGVNSRYIKSVDIIKILKKCDENEGAKKGSLLLLIMGLIMIPTGIIAFFTFQNMTGIQYSIFAYIGLIITILGVYIFIIQLASIGDLLKKYKRKKYYRNIVFYNLLKQKIRQYTRAIFVATLLITFTIFGIGFMSAGFIDGYYTALNEPYDYTVNASSEQAGITEEHILSLAKKTNTKITNMDILNGLLIGVQNVYSDGETDWSSKVVVSESNFNELAKTNISVSEGTYTLYYDSNMEYEQNTFHGDNCMFYNPVSKEEFTLKKNESVCFNGLFNLRSYFSSFLILSDVEFNQLTSSVGQKYKVTSYMMNVENWENTIDFQDAILQDVISETDGQIFENWHNSATFDKTKSKPKYFSYKGNEIRTIRMWALYPLSKLSSTTTQFQAFATYFMLMLFIAITAFVSSVMIIGLKLISTIWNDSIVYDNIHKLGMKQKSINKLMTKQMLFIYFIPTILGCAIGAFTTYRIMLVSAVIYIDKVMLIVGCLCALVIILQIIIFSMIRHKVIKQ